jgi:hypothetical protein
MGNIFSLPTNLVCNDDGLISITLFHSQRFNKAIRITHHARARMMERNINQDVLFDLIETGEIRFKDDKHCWIFKAYSDRQDNLICAATVIDEAVIIKTLMINWQLEE